MKVIFLDIDGVFNSNLWYERGNEGDFDPNTVEIFNHIIEKTGASIVISSSWRQGDTDYLRAAFKVAGIKGDIIGETPIIRFDRRGREVDAFLRGYKGIEKYCIIDDDWQIYDRHHYRYMVKTSSKVGLTLANAHDAIRILKGK